MSRKPVKLVILLLFGETVDVLTLDKKIRAVDGSAAIFNLTGKHVPSQEGLGVPVIDQPVHSPRDPKDKKTCFIGNYDPALCISIMSQTAEFLLRDRGLQIAKGTKIEFQSIQSKGNEAQRALFAQHLV